MVAEQQIKPWDILKKIVCKYIPVESLEGTYFFEDDYLRDAYPNGFGRPLDAMRAGYDELRDDYKRPFVPFPVLASIWVMLCPKRVYGLLCVLNSLFTP